MNFSRGHRDIFIFWVLLITALGLRVYGIGWGLPASYEEATPFRKAWEMWGWGLERGVDFNPHFFNYPSLTIYVQFVLQGILYAAMKLSGVVESAIDFHARYILDRTPYIIWGRGLNVLFGAFTVVLVYGLGRRIAGYAVAIPAAFWLAVSTAHIARSQMIEVDVPLAFFSLLTLWFLLRGLDRPSLKNCLFAGVAMGLAVSTKYTGALLGLPVLATGAILINRYPSMRNLRGLMNPGLVLLSALVVFAVTSPYVFLDFKTFLAHFSFESDHMQTGHFGAEEIPTWLYYWSTLATAQIGRPILLLALAGIVYSVVVLKKPRVLIPLVFLVPYCIAISTWEMKADRYLFPVLPLFCLFAGIALSGLNRLRFISIRTTTTRVSIVAMVAVVAAGPLFMMYPDHLLRLRPDTRALAGQWIRENVPSGSLIVTEQYGPNMPVRLVELDPEIRDAVESHLDYHHYAVQKIPMSQVGSEHTGIYYNIPLYHDADYIITTSFVRSRYRGNTDLYPQQTDFYKQLDGVFVVARRFTPEGRAGPVIEIYRNPEHSEPLGDRDYAEGPQFGQDVGGYAGAQTEFYFWFGYNYESYSFYQTAYDCYRRAMSYPIQSPDMKRSLVLGSSRCLVVLDRHEEALELLEGAIVSAVSAADRDYYQGIRDRVREHKTTRQGSED